MANLTYAVLVHQLPFDYLSEALELLPNKHIEKFQHDELGLKIYFKKYSPSRQCILQRVIRVQGAQYTICPLVTNLTLHGIRKYASKLTIRDIMTPYGRVVDLYPVEEISKEGNFERKSLTDDYRVILEVPEAQIDFTLSPLQLPDLRDHNFYMSFFCRICRQNGHKQIECLETFPCSISQKEEVFQNGSRNERKRSWVREEQFNSDVKSFDRFGYSQAEIKHAHSSESFSFESQNGRKYLQHEHATQVNLRDENVKDPSEPSVMFCEAQDASHTHPHDDFTSQTSFGAGQSNMTSECVSCGQEEKISRYKSKKFKPNNLPKSSGRNICSRIAPPNIPPEETKRLLRSVFKKTVLNISPKEERKLQEILEWNRDRGKKYLNEGDRKFIKWLELYLAKISRNRTQSEYSEGEQTFQPQNTTDNQISGVEMKTKRRRVLSLCPGIEEIVLKTRGVLDPIKLKNFLNQVRGRKKQTEIAALFEKNFVPLAEQLHEVVKSYYFYGKRGAREDSDIDFIKKLQNRLVQESTTKEEQNCPNEQPSFNKQPSRKRILSQNYNSKNQDDVNYCNQSEVQASSIELASGEYTAESRKYSRRKYLPSRSQSSRIPKSSPEFFPPKLSAEKFQSNPQRSSIDDGNYFKKSSTAIKSRKNFRGINKNEVTSEIRDDPEGEFETNLSFHGSRCTSGLNDNIRNDYLEASARDVERNKLKSNKRSSYTPDNSISGDSLTHHKRSVLVDNPTTESRNVVRQRSSKELTEVIKTNLRENLSCAQQSDPAEELRKMTKDHLRHILSFVHQSTEHSQFEENEGFLPE